MDSVALTHKITNRKLSAKTSMRREILHIMKEGKGPLTREEVYTIDKLLAVAKVRLIEQAK
jgi:DNA-binding Xre family transcriptional regulator